MAHASSTKDSYFVSIDNADYAGLLEKHKIYRAVPDDDAYAYAYAYADGDLRSVDESGEDYLYAASRFVPITVPAKVEASLAETG